MVPRTQITNIVFNAIDRLNELLLEEDALPKEEQTILVGVNGRLDSMGFVNFVVALEEEFSKATGRTLSLTDRFADAAAGDGQVSTVGQVIDFLEKHSGSES